MCISFYLLRSKRLRGISKEVNRKNLLISWNGFKWKILNQVSKFLFFSTDAIKLKIIFEVDKNTEISIFIYS